MFLFSPGPGGWVYDDGSAVPLADEFESNVQNCYAIRMQAPCRAEGVTMLAVNTADAMGCGKLHSGRELLHSARLEKSP
jgi:hypothetical protein